MNLWRLKQDLAEEFTEIMADAASNLADDEPMAARVLIELAAAIKKRYRI